MRTRSQSRNSNRQQQVNPTFVEPFNLVEPIENQPIHVVTMDDNHTMAQLLEAPTVGYEDAIGVPEITADNFELKHGLLTLVQNKIFFGHDKEDPHAYIRYFNKITSTMKFPNVPSRSVKLMLFPFSLEVHHNVYSPSSFIPQLEYAPSNNQQPEFSQPDSGLIVSMIQRGDDPIDAINYVMSFLTAVVTSRYPTTNNQLSNLSNPRQQATINDERVTL
ncbi:hypothetical protein Tco_1564907, partial [Tanacetum coccineum]